MDGERQSVQEERLCELQDLWSQLIAETDKRHSRLIEANRAQQFYADAAEAEAWMGEQELHMMSEEKAKVRWQPYHTRVLLVVDLFTVCHPGRQHCAVIKDRMIFASQDEQSALVMVKKHQSLEQALEDYAQTIHQLANSSRLMVNSEHPER